MSILTRPYFHNEVRPSLGWNVEGPPGLPALRWRRSHYEGEGRHVGANSRGPVRWGYRKRQFTVKVARIGGQAAKLPSGMGWQSQSSPIMPGGESMGSRQMLASLPPRRYHRFALGFRRSAL